MDIFDKILEICKGLSKNMPDIVFIGGVAVYLHATVRHSKIVAPEASHDADFMISFSDYGILKDMEEITYTPHLAKHQMVVNDVEFDCEHVAPLRGWNRARSGMLRARFTEHLLSRSVLISAHVDHLVSCNQGVSVRKKLRTLVPPRFGRHEEVK